MNGFISYLTMGTLLGLSAGISPGPLLSLLITETIKHNKYAGIKIALAPLITDLPIIGLSLFILSRLAHSDLALSIIAFAGGIFVAWLGYESLKTKGLAPGTGRDKQGSLRKGILVNFLNPHPYVFWLTVGAPLAVNAFHTSIGAVVIYFLSFYACLTGSKIIVALLTDKSKDFINNKSYVWIMRILGISLLVFALIFFYDGIRLLLSGTGEIIIH